MVIGQWITPLLIPPVAAGPPPILPDRLAIEPAETVLWETCRSRGTSRTEITRSGVKACDHRSLPARGRFTPRKLCLPRVLCPYPLYSVVVVTLPYPLLRSHALVWYGTGTASIWVVLPNRSSSCHHMTPGFSLLLSYSDRWSQANSN